MTDTQRIMLLAGGLALAAGAILLQPSGGPLPRPPSRPAPFAEPPPPPRPPRPMACTLSIDVLDVLGRQVPGAEVEVLGPEAHQVETDGRGRARLGRLPASLYEITAHHPRAGTGTAHIDLCHDEHVSARVTLGRGARVEGRIRSERGPAVGGAKIILRSPDAPGTREIESDASGRFELLGLEAGAWIATVEARGHRRQEQRLELPASGTRRLDVVLEESLTISGQVVDGAEVPLSGWRVSVVKAQKTGREAPIEAVAETPGNGEFLIEALDPGDYLLLASGPLREGPEIVSVSLPVRAGDEDVKVRAPVAASVRGVIAFEGAEPPPDYRISGPGVRLERASTEPEFVLRLLQLGEIELVAEAEGWTTSRIKVDLVPRAEISVRFILRPEKVIRGEVVDKKTQRGIPGVQVVVEGDSFGSDWLRAGARVRPVHRQEDVTEEDGRFVLKWTDPQNAKISLHHPSYPSVLRLRFGPEENRYELQEGVPITGTIWAGNVPEPGAAISFIGNEHEYVQKAVSDRAGGFSLNLPSGGIKEVRFELPAIPELSGRELSHSVVQELDVPFEGLKRLNVRARPQAPLVLLIPPGAPVTLSITPPIGTREGVWVRGTLEPGPRFVVLELLPPGAYELKAHAPGWPIARSAWLQLPHDRPIDLDAL